MRKLKAEFEEILHCFIKLVSTRLVAQKDIDARELLQDSHDCVGYESKAR